MTGRLIPDDYEMPFGKHKGEAIGDAPASYLDWLGDQDWIDKWPKVKQYIKQNRESIDEEVEQEKENMDSALEGFLDD